MKRGKLNFFYRLALLNKRRRLTYVGVEGIVKFVEDFEAELMQALDANGQANEAHSALT